QGQEPPALPRLRRQAGQGRGRRPQPPRRRPRPSRRAPRVDEETGLTTEARRHGGQLDSARVAAEAWEPIPFHTLNDARPNDCPSRTRLRASVPPCLRASVPPCLRASVPPCLRASVPPCLRG